MTAHALQAENPFSAARAAFESIARMLAGEEAMQLPQPEVERRLRAEGTELIRVFLQDHLTLRSVTEQRCRVVNANGDELTHLRAIARPVMSSFGEVEVRRLSYGGRGASSLRPLDAALNLTEDRYSLEVRRLVALAASKLSIAETIQAVEAPGGVHVPHRQAEELTVRAAIDFDTYYAARRAEGSARGEAPGTVLVLTTDGKGVPMRRADLRAATRQAAETRTPKLTKRLSKGEKRHQKRMSTVAAVYTIAPFQRTTADIVSELKSERRETEARRPRPEAKRVWASLEKEPEAVIEEMFHEASHRDPEKRKAWVALVDGNKTQIALLRAAARRHGVSLVLILDLMHVLTYLWAAAWSFFPEGSPEGEQWVSGHLATILEGRSGDVAGGIRRKATRNGLDAATRKAADSCASYLITYREMLRYDDYLAIGYPIATGVIEGACRYLVKDRMEITGARWTLTGAEAILKLRALVASGDFADYWTFHEAAEHKRVHAVHYAKGLPPRVTTGPKIPSRKSRPHLRVVK
jgi:hypothetical protein